MTPRLELITLGSLALRAESFEPLPGRRKLLSILAYLSRARGQSPGVDRARLAELFWPGPNEARARASLRQALTELREVLGEGLVTDGNRVALASGAIDCDADRFEEEVERQDYPAALRRWAGEFLADAETGAGESFRGWLEIERESLRLRFGYACRAYVEDCSRRLAWQEAAETAARWSTAFPGDAYAARQWLELLRLSGQRVEALAEAAALIARWRSDFEEDPPAELVAFTRLERLEISASSSRAIGGTALFTPELTGRQAELARLTGLWHRVLHGEPGVALIEGDEGLGKSRLLGAFLQWLQQMHPETLVLRAQAHELEQSTDWLALRHLLRRLPEAPGLAASPSRVLESLGTIVPEIAERFPAHSNQLLPPIHEALTRALGETGSEAPLVVALDDAHLTDPATRIALEHLSRHPAERVLLLLTSVPGSVRIFEGEPGGPDHVHRIRLAPLTEDELPGFLASTADFDSEDRRELAHRLYVESAGNPLALTELLSALADEGWIAPDSGGVWRLSRPLGSATLPIPGSLQDATESRLRHLTPDARYTLEAASVTGSNPELPLVAEMTGFEPGRLERALDELLVRRMLRPSPDGSLLTFAHDVLRRAVYSAMSPLRRAELHAAAYEALRRRAGRDGAQLALLRHHRERTIDRHTWWQRPRVRLVSVAALMAFGVGVVLLSRNRSIPQATTVRLSAVTVRGDSAAPELGPATAELLRSRIESMRDIRVVQDGNGKAEATVLSTIRARGARLDLSTVWISGSGDTISTAAASAPSNQLSALTSTVARELFRGQRTPSIGEFRVEAAQTESPAALLQYARGERLARRFEMVAAAQAYFAALQADRSFAAAWHGLSRTNGWFGLGDRQRRAADSALAHAEGLPLADLSVLEGWSLFSRGRADEAERRFRSILAYAPHFGEAEVGAAEVLFHHNWMRGRDGLESRGLWLAAAEADPGDWRPLAHLWEVNAKAGRWIEAGAWYRRMIAARQDTVRTPSDELWLALFAGDELGVRDALKPVDSETEWELASLVVALTTVADRPDLAELIARKLTTPERVAEVRAFGWQSLAHLAMVEGRWREGLVRLDSAGALEPGSTARVESELGSAPFLPSLSFPGVVDAASRHRLSAKPSAVRRTFLFWFDYEQTRAAAFGPYLARLADLRNGNRAGYVGALPSIPLPPGDSVATAAGQLAPSLEAWARLERHDTAGAIATFASSWEGVEYTSASYSACLSRPWDRFKLGELYEATGDLDQARGWFGGLGWIGLPDAIYSAPAALHRGRIAERQGNVADARAAYARVLRLWNHADPEFQPMVSEARARLAALGS